MIISQIITEATKVNQIGEAINMVQVKTVKFLGVPIFRNTFIKEVDDSDYEYQPPENVTINENKVIGFGAPLREIEEKEDEREIINRKY